MAAGAAGGTDLYATLGVAQDADTETIRKAYRKLARQNHPDLNPGDEAAEERFKEIARAFEVLSDEDRRKNYDEFGEISLEAGFDADEARKAREAFGARFGGYGGYSGHGGYGPPGAGFGGGGHDFADSFQFGGIDDLLGRMFRGEGAAPGGAPGMGGIRMRGHDLEASLELDFLEAVRGGEKQLSLARPQPDGSVRPETLKVRIPAGVDSSGKLRLAGKGGAGLGGGPAGDLFVTISVRPHPVFQREGRDLLLDVPISVREATLGGPVDVPTLEGRATLTVPPGSDGGTRLRLRGKGVPGAGGRPDGDLIVRLQIQVPKFPDGPDAETKEAIEALDRHAEPDLRGGLFR